MSPLLIVNPRARLAASIIGLPDALIACLHRHGIHSDARVTREPGEATDLARGAEAQGYEAVIVAGGDGTINGVVNGLAGSDVPMGLIPLGTGNALGHHLGLKPGDIEGACGLIAGGCVKRVDLGRLNGRRFISMAGLGMDAAIVQRIHGRRKARLGAYGFVAESVKALMSQEPWEFEGEIDGRSVGGRAWALVVCNTAQYTWRVRMTPGAVDDDGLLDFVFIRDPRRLAVLGGAARVLVAGASVEGRPGVDVIRGRRLTMRTTPEAPWQVDGEVGGTGAVEGDVEPLALGLIGAEGGES